MLGEFRIELAIPKAESKFTQKMIKEFSSTLKKKLLTFFLICQRLYVLFEFISKILYHNLVGIQISKHTYHWRYIKVYKIYKIMKTSRPLLHVSRLMIFTMRTCFQKGQNLTECFQLESNCTLRPLSFV